MSLPRFAGWGAMGGGLLSILWVVTLLVAVGAQPLALATAFVVLVTLLGAGSAAGTLALARKADDGERLDAGADVAEVGLTKEERRELLGTQRAALPHCLPASRSAASCSIHSGGDLCRTRLASR